MERTFWLPRVQMSASMYQPSNRHQDAATHFAVRFFVLVDVNADGSRRRTELSDKRLKKETQRNKRQMERV